MKTGLIERYINGGKNTLSENIIVCVAAALSGTFYFYEYFYESFFPLHSTLSILITCVIAVIWMLCAAFSGKDGKIGFIIFSFLYWSLPYIYILYYSSRDNVRNYSKWLAMINKIASALLVNPFQEAAEKLGTSAVTLAAVMLILVMILYAVGFFIKRSYVSRKESLLEMSDDDYDGEYEMDEEEDDSDEDYE